MAKSPRKSFTPSQASPDPADDLFAGESGPPPEATMLPEALPEEWLLDEPDAAATDGESKGKPRTGISASLPGNSPSARQFESNKEAALPPMALPAAGIKSRDEAKPTPPSASTSPAPPSNPAPESEPEPPMALTIDPFHIDDELPSVPQSQPVIVDEPEPDPPPIEFADDGAESDGKSAPVKLIKTGLPIALALALVIPGIFALILRSGLPESSAPAALSKPSLPIKGQVITMSEATSSWRSRQKDDLISTVEVFLPAVSREQATMVPQVQFTIDPASTKTGFVRFIFFNNENRISGDVRILSVAGGTMKPLNSGAVVEGNKATIYGSVGFMDNSSFIGYATDETTRWSVEISESTDYNAKESGWTRLQTFNIKDSTIP